VAWADFQLCTQEDIEGEISSLETLCAETEEGTAALVETVMAKAKGDIRRKLKGELQNIFLTSLQYNLGFPYDYAGWIEELGLPWDDDSLLDYLANPEELNDAAIARSIYRLYLRIGTSLMAKYGSVDDATKSERKQWECEFDERFEESKGLLWFDLNKDGKISKSELVRGRQGIRIA
jgi:hypothetical protein